MFKDLSEMIIFGKPKYKNLKLSFDEVTNAPYIDGIFKGTIQARILSDKNSYKLA